MSGALQAIFQNQRSFLPAGPTVIGQAFGGGFYAGQIGVSGVATHYIIVAPKSVGQANLQCKTSNGSTSGTLSVIDGPANTAAMIVAGAAAHPAAQFCDNLVVGSVTDWYLAAKNELEILYFNLKPTTQANDTTTGINPNAVPVRASNYTAGNPAQTSATIFKTGNTEAMNATIYWASTESSLSSSMGYQQYFDMGLMGYYYKAIPHDVRAIRRIAV